MTEAVLPDFFTWYDKHRDPSAPLGSFFNPDPRKPAHDSADSVAPTPDPKPEQKPPQHSSTSRKHRRRPSWQPAAEDLDSGFGSSNQEAPVPSSPRKTAPRRRSSLRGGRRMSLENRHVHFDHHAMPVANGPCRPDVEGIHEYIEKGTIHRSPSPNAQPRTSMPGKYSSSSSSSSERSHSRRQKKHDSRARSLSPPRRPPKIPISHSNTPSSTSFARLGAARAMQVPPASNNTTTGHNTHQRNDHDHDHQSHHCNTRHSRNYRSPSCHSTCTDSSTDTFVLAPSHTLSPNSQCMPPASVSHHHYHYNNDSKTHSPERRTCEDCLRLGRVQVGSQWYCRGCAPAAKKRYDAQRPHRNGGDGAGDECRDAPTAGGGEERVRCHLCNKRLHTPYQRGAEPLCHHCRAITTGAYPQPASGATTHLGFGHDIALPTTGTAANDAHDEEVRKKCILCSVRYAVADEDHIPLCHECYVGARKDQIALDAESENESESENKRAEMRQGSRSNNGDGEEERWRCDLCGERMGVERMGGVWLCGECGEEAWRAEGEREKGRRGRKGGGG